MRYLVGRSIKKWRNELLVRLTASTGQAAPSGASSSGGPSCHPEESWPERKRDRAEALFSLHGSRRLCEKLAVGFTAAGLLAISLCIDSLLKAIDFQPAACVHM